MIGKIREWLKNGNWGLKILSLVLAIIIYHAVKTESARQTASVQTQQNDRTTNVEPGNP